MNTDITISNVGSMHPNVSSFKTNNYTVLTSDYVVGIGSLSSSILTALTLKIKNSRRNPEGF